MSLWEKPVRPREVELTPGGSVPCWEEISPENREEMKEGKEGREEKERRRDKEKRSKDHDKENHRKDHEKEKHRKDREKDKDREKKDDRDKEKEKEKKRSASKLSSLSAQLIAHGHTKRPLKLDGLSSSEQAHISNILTDLLGATASKVTALEDTNTRLRTLQYEHERLLKGLEKHERAVARMETDVQAAKIQTADAERRQKEEEGKAKLLREDVARGRKAIDNLKVAATQEAKRAQLKLDKVLGQLSRQVPLVPPKFELMNPVPPGHIAPVAAGPIPLIEASLADLSSLRQSLQEEIDSFRHVAVSTANSLREALAAGRGEEPPPRLLAEEFYAVTSTSRHVKQVASWTAHPSIADTRLKALVADVRTALTTEISPIMRDGNGVTEAEAEEAEEARRLERAREREVADLRDRVKDLEVELQIAAAKNEEANRVVEQMAKMSVQGGVPSTTDFADTRLRDELVRQKRELDAEREALRERDVRFNEERMELDAAKAAFAADRDAAVAAALAAHAEETAKAAAAAEAEARAREDAVPLAPASPKPKHRHHPASPSPLSPHRSPAKLAGGARRRPPRTPLSRLVLERATLDRDRRKTRLGASLRTSRSVSGTGKSAGGGAGAAAGSSSADAPPTGAASEAGSSTAPSAGVLSNSGRDNFLAPPDKGKGKMEASLRKSSTLLSSTAAARARAAEKGVSQTEDAREKDRARSSTGSASSRASGSGASGASGKARAWR